MASYTQGNDYQTYQVDPYKLPAQQIVQAIQTRDAYWDAGASQLKNAYENYLNLDLTRKDNKDQLDNMMTGVNNQLKKSAQSDLSIAGNVSDAMSSFEPIYKNDNIMGDNALTKHYRSQLAMADSYRQKDNGKEYSDTNVKYLMQGLQDYASDPSANNWRKYFNERREYSPFHDVGAETHQLLKDFKPTTYTKTEAILDSNGVPTGYLRKVVDKEQSDQELNSYLQSNLSDAAKQQMKINGSVLYNRNYAQVGQQVYSDNSDRISTYNRQIDRLNVDIKNPKATTAEKAAIQMQIDGYNSEIDDYKSQNNKMKSGDYGFIKDNYDAYAGAAYSKAYIRGVASSNARVLDRSQTISPDEVALTHLREADKFSMELQREGFQAKENSLDREVARERIAATKKSTHKPGLDENGNIIPSEVPSMPWTKTGDESADQTTDYTNWLKDKQDTKDSQDTAVKGWNDYITNKARDAGIDISNKTSMDQYKSTFETNNPNDPTFLSYKNKVEDDNFRIKALDWMGHKADDQINQEYKDKINDVLEEGKEAGPGVVKALQAMLQSSDFKAIKGGENTYRSGGFGQKFIYTPITVQANGKTFDISHEDMEKANDIIESKSTSNSLSNAINGKSGLLADIDGRRKEILSADYSRFKGYREFTDVANAGFNKLQKNVDSKLGVDDKAVSIRGFDREGNIYIKLNSADPKVLGKFQAGMQAWNGYGENKMTLDQSYRKDKQLFIMHDADKLGFNLNSISDPKIDLLKGLATIQEERNPKQNTYFNQPNDWPMKIGDEYYKFEMHYVDGKEHWFPIHVGSEVKFREQVGGYDTPEQAVAELGNKDSQQMIKKYILSKKPDYKFN